MCDSIAGLSFPRDEIIPIIQGHKLCLVPLQMIAVEPSFDGVVIDVGNLRRVAAMSSRASVSHFHPFS